MKQRNALLGGIGAAFVALALLGVFAFELADTQAKSRKDVAGRVHERATLAAALIDSLFQASAQQTPEVARKYGTRVVSDRTLEDERENNTYMVLLDASGRVLAQSRGFNAQGRDAVARSRAVKRVQAGKPYAVGDVMPYGKTGVVNFVVPIDTPFGRRLRVTGFAPALLSAFIEGELRKIPGVAGAQSYLIDGRNAVIASTDPARQLGFSFRDPAEVAVLRRPSGSLNDRYYDQARLVGASWRLVLVAPEDALFASVSGLRKWVPWAIFAAFAIVTLAAFLLARRLLQSSDRVRAAGVELAHVNAELEATNSRLARRAAELARSNEELDRFASIASHDLQEPLRKVRTFSQRLTVMEAEHLSEKGRDYLERSNAAAERMQQLIEDLLKFSRVSTEDRPFRRVDLGAVTREVLEDLEHEVDRCGAVVDVEELPTISGDALQLRQLMQNLISNALKFRREGVVPEVTIGSEVSGDVAIITVRDNGIGFDPQYALRIFRVFERLHGRGQYPGTGIGLALCRKIAERHGGAIQAEGEPGVGSTFTVTLPVDQREEVIVTNARDHEALLTSRTKEPLDV